MQKLIINLGELSGMGRAIERLAQNMPDSNLGSGCDCGADAVTGLVDQISSEINNNVLGAAAEMYRLGQGLSAAVQAVADADALSAGS